VLGDPVNLIDSLGLWGWTDNNSSYGCWIGPIGAMGCNPNLEDEDEEDNSCPKEEPEVDCTKDFNDIRNDCAIEIAQDKSIDYHKCVLDKELDLLECERNKRYK